MADRTLTLTVRALGLSAGLSTSRRGDRGEMTSRPESRATSPGRRSFLFSGPSTPKTATTPGGLRRTGSRDDAGGSAARPASARPSSAAPRLSSRSKSLATPSKTLDASLGTNPIPQPRSGDHAACLPAVRSPPLPAQTQRPLRMVPCPWAWRGVSGGGAALPPAPHAPRAQQADASPCALSVGRGDAPSYGATCVGVPMLRG